MIAAIVFSGICAALVWSCFCRLVRTDRETITAVRAGLFTLAVASLAAAVAPWLAGYRPEWPSIALAAGMLATQVTTARFWAYGTPCQFKRAAS